MDADAVVVRTAGLMSAPVEDDLVILNPARDDYVALSEVGRRIWELLEAPRAVDDLCRQLGEEFEAEPDRIAAEVTAFLDELEVEGLLDVVGRRPA